MFPQFICLLPYFIISYPYQADPLSRLTKSFIGRQNWKFLFIWFLACLEPLGQARCIMQPVVLKSMHSVGLQTYKQKGCTGSLNVASWQWKTLSNLVAITVKMLFHISVAHEIGRLVLCSHLKKLFYGSIFCHGSRNVYKLLARLWGLWPKIIKYASVKEDCVTNQVHSFW